jgi:pyruvate dehydrogenase kinase 2/3/4
MKTSFRNAAKGTPESPTPIIPNLAIPQLNPASSYNIAANLSHKYYNNLENIDCSPAILTYTDSFVKAIEGIKQRHDPVVTTMGKWMSIILKI